MSCGVRIFGSARQVATSPIYATEKAARKASHVSVAIGRDLPHPSILFALLLACAGSVLGVVSAAQAELPTGILAPWIFAPIIEESVKPAGVYLILVKWPGALKHQLYTALLTAVSGASFGLVESAFYILLFASDQPPGFVAFRLTIPVMMHALASFTFGLGINRQLRASLSTGLRFSVRNWGFFLTAIVIHSVYNITITVVEI